MSKRDQFYTSGYYRDSCRGSSFDGEFLFIYLLDCHRPTLVLHAKCRAVPSGRQSNSALRRIQAILFVSSYEWRRLDLVASCMRNKWLRADTCEWLCAALMVTHDSSLRSWLLPRPPQWKVCWEKDLVESAFWLYAALTNMNLLSSTSLQLLLFIWKGCAAKTRRRHIIKL